MSSIKTYKEPRWLALRKRVLARDKYLDQYWKRYGKFINADMVHHVFPVEFFPQYQWEEWNLVSVSKKTHMMLHDRENDELTDMGKELLQYVARKNRIVIPEWYLKSRKGKNYRYFHGKGEMG